MAGLFRKRYGSKIDLGKELNVNKIILNVLDQKEAGYILPRIITAEATN